MEEKKTKVCSHCHRELPVSMFNKSSNSPDGLQASCKECKNEMQESYYRKKEEKKLMVPSSTKKVYHLEALAGISNKDLIEELKARGFTGKLEYTYKIDM